jgi:multicomponent Na+:H+ antiporter subunit B
MTVQPEPHAVESDGEPVHRRWVAAVLVGGMLAVLVIGFTRLPGESSALPDIARQAMALAIPRWGTLEPVSEVVYGTRGFDTFGETFLLLAAVVSVSVLTRSREPRDEYVGEAAAGRTEQRENDPHPGKTAQESQARTAESAEQSVEQPPEPDRSPLGTVDAERAEAMTVIVQVAARAAALILVVAAVYLAAWGFSPGGGFPAGAALSGVAVVLYAAFGYRRVKRVVKPGVLEPVEAAGAAMIIAVELIGLLVKGSFGANWLPLAPLGTIRSGGIMQVFSGAELIEVGTGLTIAMFSLLGMAHDWTSDDTAAEERRDQEQQS